MSRLIAAAAAAALLTTIIAVPAQAGEDSRATTVLYSLHLDRPMSREEVRLDATADHPADEYRGTLETGFTNAHPGWNLKLAHADGSGVTGIARHTSVDAAAFAGTTLSLSDDHGEFLVLGKLTNSVFCALTGGEDRVRESAGLKLLLRNANGVLEEVDAGVETHDMPAVAAGDSPWQEPRATKVYLTKATRGLVADYLPGDYRQVTGRFLMIDQTDADGRSHTFTFLVGVVACQG
ncbi:hypothetical protein Lesp02_69920 [Lentzea sp. NBRC 105346]|uniref:hypothetical protein n=1 Tax=Lentzea sp. NBRC 105346 TaxID=3032205 RepID=UPI0024A1FF50|nr:hypothetical protein [Lentzea sp. NBRC 105346]GLZ34805.1 hypothetical protein Lesp02_69920 [Lentzea sp. NBRC 105346]